jgi:hypothetical protein
MVLASSCQPTQRHASRFGIKLIMEQFRKGWNPILVTFSGCALRPPRGLSTVDIEPMME